MRIPEHIVQNIRDASDIVEVVSDFLTLKKKGKDYKACCPFHNEKTPSFSVSPQRNIFKCFGCGKGGDSVSFVMEHEKMSYIEALKYLAKKYGIDLPEETEQPISDEARALQNEKESILIVLERAKDFFHSQLFHNEEGKNIGLTYFKERGFNVGILQTFEIGYSPDSYDALYQYLTSMQFMPEVMEKAGLIIKRNNADGYFDRFRGRVIFPIHDKVGKVIGFGGRTLSKAKKVAKYINSPESLVYQKSQILYGLYHAKKAIRQHDQCLLVEGYADTIALHQAGLQHVVASSGTSLTVEQIKQIKRFSNKITLLFDGDVAGLNASLRGVDLILEEGMQVYVVTFPEGDDPDSYLQKVGTNDFTTFIDEERQDFISFKAGILIQDAQNDPFKRAEAIKSIVQTIAKVPDSIQRQVFYKSTAQIFKIDEQDLINEGNKIIRKTLTKKKQQKNKQPKPNPPKELDPNDLLSFSFGDAYDDVGENFNFGFEEATPLPQDQKQQDSTSDRILDSVISQERECIRLLLNYATVEIDDSQYLIDYILAEIQEINFQSPLYIKILEIFEQGLKEGKILDADYFIQSQDSEIRQEAIDLITDKYQLSDHWKTLKPSLPDHDERLDNVTYTHLMRLKFRFVQKLVEDNAQKLKGPLSNEEQLEVLQQHQELKTIEMEIAQILGNVIR